ncbi:Site-specific recombinase XerD [Succinivibrio dextrinosolvens]|uniref:tyrosine-type recombinase/integrase n=1 Tax=Succinivibrio dextrinosolvens TaxID=83771 RepID=UPI0008E897B7|nr:tyrosine-type recombinase/integrase [Succinivibrio dextrinosolvens]SFS92067.1 Site-specific recombinase XerD [Succinivibrio dextrinosolvens]
MRHRKKDQWCKITRSSNHVSKDIVIKSSKYKCPAWAERYIACYLGRTKLGCRKINALARSVFLGLVEYAASNGCNEISKVSEEIVKNFLNNCHNKYRNDVRVLKRIVLWLTALGELPTSIYRNLFLSGEHADLFSEIERLFGGITAANDFLDLTEKEPSRLPIPEWALDVITKYGEVQKKGGIYSSITCHKTRMVQALVAVRILVRRYGIKSFSELIPSHVREFRKCMVASTACYHFSAFFTFLSQNNIIKGCLLAAFLTNFPKIYLLNNMDLSGYPDGHLSADEFYALRNEVRMTFLKLGYKDKTISCAMVGIELHSLFLIEHGFCFSLAGALWWCSRLSIRSKRKGTYRTALYFAHKLSLGESIKPDVILEERYCALKCNIKFPSWAEDTCLRFFQQRRKDGLGESSIKQEQYKLLYLIRYLDTRAICSFAELTTELIHDFNRDCNPGGASYKADINCSVRLFLLYLAEKDIVRYSLPLAVPVQSRQHEQLVKTLNHEQLQEVYRFCKDANGESGKRVALAFKLALNMGLRSVDIVNLRFDSIDVEKQVLRFVQRKTSRFIELPIPSTVLNALYEYLSTTRSNYKNDRVMLRINAPHCRIKSTPVIRQTVDSLNCEHFTLHQMRRTFASLLLKAGTDFEEIAECLGHSDANTVHAYISTDTEMLRQCCYPFTGFEMGLEVLK